MSSEGRLQRAHGEMVQRRRKRRRAERWETLGTIGRCILACAVGLTLLFGAVLLARYAWGLGGAL